MRPVEWRAIGQSVRGASHVRSGLPNQDAIRWLPASRVGPPLILTVSDGHGSPRNFRSDIGSRLAVEETAWLVQDLLDGQPDPGNLSAIKRTAEERLLEEVVRRWQKAVDEHLSKNPFTQEELDTLEEKRGARARRDVESAPRLAYGATIVTVLITSSFVLYLQLGDGDILVISDKGEVKRPLPDDPRLIANETTSLCMRKAWRDIRFHFQALFGEYPALILLATDGYANSFVDEAGFFKVGTDILDMLQHEGPEMVEENLGTWLEDASTAGSGDDITLGILYRTDIVGSASKPQPKPKPKPKPEPEPEPEPAKAEELPPAQPETEAEATAAPTEPQEEPPRPTGKGIERIKSEGPKEPTKKLPLDK